MIARDPKIAYVLLRNAHFGPRLASSVELCVRDLVLHSRYAGSTLVVCPPVDEPFEGIEIATIADVSLRRKCRQGLGRRPAPAGGAGSTSRWSRTIFPPPP